MLDCPTCGASLRHWDDFHSCVPSDHSDIEFALAKTDEEKAEITEAVRRVYSIDEEFWYRDRPDVHQTVRRIHEQKG